MKKSHSVIVIIVSLLSLLIAAAQLVFPQMPGFLRMFGQAVIFPALGGLIAMFFVWTQGLFRDDAAGSQPSRQDT